MDERPDRTDLLILGGGLAGGLIALALAARRPEVAVTIVEAGETLGGNHVWSFFDGDLDAPGRALVDPLVVHRWPGYDVAFPGFARTLASGYNSLTSEALDGAVRRALPAARIVTGQRAVEVRPGGATLDDGRAIAAGGVIDARGAGETWALDLGWQKFVGVELRTEHPHGIVRPMVMDATVAQIDGYRFVYLLPFAADRVFVEDTYYSSDPHLDTAALEVRIDEYAAARDWRVAARGRAEAGVLPVAMGGDFDAYWGGEGVAKAGLRAGLFHPTTGYSLPDAAHTAGLVTGLEDLSGAALHSRLREYAARAWGERGFYRLLDRMLFRAAAPAERWRVLAHFYRGREEVIARFYAAASTRPDVARILCGRPPVPVGRALRAMWR